MTQLTLPCLPKARGGSRSSSGRKRGAVETQTIRVATGIADACKNLDARYRETLTAPETEQATLLALNDRAIVVRTTAEERLLAERIVDEMLAGPLAELTDKQKKSFIALLLERLLDMYPDDVIYPHSQK